MRTHELVAYNTAIASDNKIHDDSVAHQFGFKGGLVPGVDVYAYLCWGPVSEWGPAWLERGTAEFRIGLPTYDGDLMTLEWEPPTCVIRNPAGVVVITATMDLPDRPGSLPAQEPPRLQRPDPADRPPASRESLAVGTHLGAYQGVFRAEAHRADLEDMRESLPIYRDLGIAHPAWLLRTANWVLSDNVVLGPWMHVGSRIQYLGLVHDGAEVEARATVVAEYEKKGHRFCELDVAVVADGAPVARIAHTAIYQPRQVAAA
jgi:hypothetical protein